MPFMAVAQPSPHFTASWIFEGSDLSGWQTIGQTSWAASSGRITATPAGNGGWLVLPQSYQDQQFGLRFRCEGACDAGVLMRMTRTAGGGFEGILIALGDSLGLFRATFDANGRPQSRTRLYAAPAMIRIAPVDDAARPSGSEAIVSGWNSLHVAIDANIVRAALNGWRSATGITDDASGGYGPVALYAGGTGAVVFENVAALDYNLREVPPETVSDRFTMQRLDEFYYAWDTAIADINQDGVLDVVSGAYYYLGPDYTTRHEIYLGVTYNPSVDYADNMITHAHDFTGDGWPDVLATEMRPMVLYVNPRGESRRWDRHEAITEVISESTILHDMDADGAPEVVHAYGNGILAYAEPNPADPTAPWTVHTISEPMGFGALIHGLGVGDVNGDGRPDILFRGGWFEQPATPTPNGHWPFHAFPFTTAGGIEGHGGARMSVVDLNGDGLNDVVTALSAHGWGMAWFEQTRDASGAISFEPHLIMGDLTSDNPDDIAFSQLHAGVEMADIDRDGLPDLVTGKRYWAHLDSSTDPNPYGEAVLYWYRTVRDANAPGGLRFVPERIHNRSGVGSAFEVGDLNADGAVDVVTSTDRGTFIFWGRR